MTKRFRVVVLLVVFALLVLISRNIEAEEIAFATTSGTVTFLENPVTAYEQKDTSSNVITEFSEGDSIFVTGADENWTEIFYKGETGYIPTDQIGNENIAAAAKSAEELGQAVEDEINKNDLDTSIAIDNYMRKQKQELNSLIWKIAIGVLVAAVIAVSIIIGIMNQDAIKEPENINNNENMNENNSDDKNENEIEEKVAEKDDTSEQEKGSVNETDYSDSVL